MGRSILDEAHIHPAVRETVANNHADIVQEVKDAVAKNDMVIVGMAQNPMPKKARKLLDQQGLAYKYLGDRNMAWTLTEYNLSKDGRFERGQVILIPLSHLDLTEEGKRLARSDQLMVASEAGGMSRHHTEQVRQHIPELQAHLHAGRYVETLALANRLLTGPALPNKLQGELHFILTEANVALGALNEAEIHCKKFQEVAPNARLDPVYVSPKIMDICGVDSTIEAIAPQNIPKDQPNRAP